MRVSKKGVGLAIVTLCIVAMASVAYAQATSTFNGRVVDQADAVLPGVTVTVTNSATGVVRTAVSNGEGMYLLPGLDPGTYQVKTELAGFAESVRDNVRLNVNSTITIDFKLALAGLNETLTVTGEAPLIQATQSKVANTIETTELQNLPMITRTISGMLELLPGAAPVAALHRTKESVGTVSYGGSSGGNVIPTVDGADNRDNHYSGPLMSFTTESLEQFQLASNQFSAADGRSSGAAISLVTKSGTNELHGTVFGYERDRKLTSKDYFTQQANATKTPFGRQQYGGSIGGPLIRNKMVFFGAVEQQQEHQGIFVPQDLYAQLDALVPQLAAGRLPLGSINPNHPRELNLPRHLRMFTAKGNAQLNNKQSLMVRYAGQDEARDAVTWPAANNNDNGQPDNMSIKAFSVVAQHSYVLGNAGLNQITGQMNQMDYLADVVDAVTGKHYARLSERRPARPASGVSVRDHGRRRRCRDPVAAARLPASRRRFAAERRSLAEIRCELQLPVASRHPQRQRDVRDPDVLRRSVDDHQQHERALSAGIPDAGHFAHVAASERGRGWRPGLLGRHDHQCATVRHVDPG
jgi:hypothetical protein